MQKVQYFYLNPETIMFFDILRRFSQCFQTNPAIMP